MTRSRHAVFPAGLLFVLALGACASGVGEPGGGGSGTDLGVRVDLGPRVDLGATDLGGGPGVDLGMSMGCAPGVRRGRVVLRRSLRQPRDRRGELRHLRHRVRRGAGVRVGLLRRRVPDALQSGRVVRGRRLQMRARRRVQHGAVVLQRRVRGSADQRAPLRDVRDGLRDGAGLHGGPVPRARRLHACVHGRAHLRRRRLRVRRDGRRVPGRADVQWRLLRHADLHAVVHRRPHVHGRPLRLRFDGRRVPLGADLLGRFVRERWAVRGLDVRAPLRDVLRRRVLFGTPGQFLLGRCSLRDALIAERAARATYPHARIC